MRAWCVCAGLVLFACGDDDLVVEPGEPGLREAGAASSSSSSGAILEAGAADAAPLPESNEPVGVDALTPHAFTNLATLRLGTRVHHASSFARDGGNGDYGVGLGTDAHGDSVLWDRLGPGSLRRIWFTGFSADQRVKMYFDGEIAPRVDATITQFFGGATVPFSSPLALDATATSGGFLSLLPFPYAAGLTVTVSGGVRYFNIDGHDLAGAATSWTGAEDTVAARALLARAGVDPKPGVSQLEVASTFDLDASATTTLLDVGGPRSIDAIEITVPGVVPLAPQTAAPANTTEDGRILAGSSAYVLAIDPANFGVMLQRRIDYAVADQRVQIAVDGATVGEWVTLGSDAAARWRDVGFWVPEAITRGKAQLSVAAEGTGWNEYDIRAVSHTERGPVETDAIDVGNVASESAHAYVAVGSTLVSTTARLPTHASLAPLLNDLHLAITWDDDAAPSVDAPLGSLFGVGAFGPGFTAGVGAGLRADGTLYLYFPMPFAQRARVVLRNAGATVAGIRASVRHSAYAGSFDDVGAFSSSYFAGPSVAGSDLPFVSADGSGQIVAVTESVQSARARGFMQGDERVYVDGARTPVVQGTGTEDFYNGGFYFSAGPFGTATHGESVLSLLDDGVSSGTAMYRQFLSDPIPYRAGVSLSIEHGGHDDVDVQATMLALFYRQARARLVQTDMLAIGDGASEIAHGYAVVGETFAAANTFTFEGDHDDVELTATGRGHRGSQLDVVVDPAHVAVAVRRLFDQSTPQRADVWIDGAFAGTWYTAETNASHRWREEDFWLPPALTGGKSKLHVELRVPAGAPAWNEYELRALSRLR